MAFDEYVDVRWTYQDAEERSNAQVDKDGRLHFYEGVVIHAPDGDVRVEEVGSHSIFYKDAWAISLWQIGLRPNPLELYKELLNVAEELNGERPL